MTEYDLQQIWNKNLKEFHGVMRLDAIIIKAMKEAIELKEKKQSNANPDCPGGCKDVYHREGGTFKCKDCGKVFY